MYQHHFCSAQGCCRVHIFLKVKIRINSSQGCWQVPDHNFQAVLWIVGGRGVVMINILQPWPGNRNSVSNHVFRDSFPSGGFFCHFFVQRLSSGHVFSGHYASRNITGRNNAVKNKSARQKSAERWSGERKSAYKKKKQKKTSPDEELFWLGRKTHKVEFLVDRVPHSAIPSSCPRLSHTRIFWRCNYENVPCSISSIHNMASMRRLPVIGVTAIYSHK